MTRPSRLGAFLLAIAFVPAACAQYPPAQPTPLTTETAADYEFYNPTPCVAIAYAVDQTGSNRTELGRVPSGTRLLIRVPPLPRGTHVTASATASDGTDCERGYHIVVRRMES